MAKGQDCPAWYVVGDNLVSSLHVFIPHLGAVMISGFDIKEGIDFQEVVQQYEPKLSDAYRGTSPRKLIPGTQVLSMCIIILQCNCIILLFVRPVFLVSRGSFLL